MVIKREKATNAYILLIVICFTFFTSCMEKDFYDPNYKTNSPFQDLQIPEGFDWSMFSNINLTIDVKDEYNGDYYYIIEAFDQNPVANDAATLLTRGIAKQGEPFTALLALPKDLSTLYIRQTTPTKLQTVRAITINGKEISLTFNPVCNTTNQKTMPRNIADTRNNDLRPNFKLPDLSEITAVITSNTPSDYTLKTKGVYVLESYDGNLKFPGEGDVKLYITGKWHNAFTSNQTLQDNALIAVMNGGEITSPANKQISGSNHPVFAVMEGGKVEMPNITFHFNTDGEILNSGNFTANLVHLPSKAILFNDGIMKLSTLKINSTNKIINNNLLNIQTIDWTNGIVTNNHSITAQALNMNGTEITNNGHFIVEGKSTFINGEIINQCYFSSDNVQIKTGTEIDMKEGSLFTCNDFEANGADIDMGSSSMLNVNGTATFSQATCIIEGEGNNLALARFKKIVISGWQKIIFKNNVEVECSDYTHNTQWQSYYVLDGASMVEEGKATAIIPSDPDGCNTIGNNPTPEQPVDPDFPIIVPEGTVYTFAIEDNWPVYGDYDMNDLVMDMELSYEIGKKNYVEELEIKILLRAIGATRPIAAGIQLDGISPDLIENIKYDDYEKINEALDGTIFQLNSNGTETEQKYAVIPLFDNAYAALGTPENKIANTYKGSGTDPVKIEIKIQFKDKNLKKEDIHISKLNFFIVTDKKSSERKEIHLGGFYPTDKADLRYFKNHNNNIYANNYISKDNLVWGFIIPSTPNSRFRYPAESKNIQNVYKDFKGWASSGGTQNQDWYRAKNVDEESIY